MSEFVRSYMERMKQGLDRIDRQTIEEITDVLLNAWKNNRQVFILGNGGSASLASHFACDLGKGTLSRHYDRTEKRFRVISLTDNSALISAYANDLGYEDIFAQQLNNLVKSGDVVIGISGSGNSINVIKAIELASACNATTIAFLGFDGGKLKGLVDRYVIFPEHHYGRVEDFHLMLVHMICEELSRRIREHKPK